MKKKNIVLLSALLFSVTAVAQTEVTAGVTRGKDYGVTYVLPKTEIELTVQVTKNTYTPGEFSKYADRYLRLNNVSSEPETYWTLDKIQTEVIGVPGNGSPSHRIEQGWHRLLHQYAIGQRTEKSSSGAAQSYK